MSEFIEYRWPAWHRWPCVRVGSVDHHLPELPLHSDIRVIPAGSPRAVAPAERFLRLAKLPLEHLSVSVGERQRRGAGAEESSTLDSEEEFVARKRRSDARLQSSIQPLNRDGARASSHGRGGASADADE